MYIVLFAFPTHVFRPDAGLYFSDVGFAKVEHAQARLAYTATDGKRKCILHQAFVEVKLQTTFFIRLFELA